jgi:hypothetical protein
MWRCALYSSGSGWGHPKKETENGEFPAYFELSGLSARTVVNVGPNNNLQHGHRSVSSFTSLFSFLKKTNKSVFVRFEVFTAVTMKNTVYSDVASCKYFVNRRFGGTYRLNLQGILNPQAMSQSTDTCSGWFIARGFLTP